MTPCPVCGKEPTVEYHGVSWRVWHFCEERPASYIELTDHFESHPEAVKAWEEWVGKRAQE